MMGENIKSIIMFTAGLAIGSVVTWKLVEAKYAKIAEDEINDIRDYYDEKAKNITTEAEVVKVENKPDISEYAAKIEKNGYKNYHEISEKPVKKEHKNGAPYIITPEEFGEIDEYETVNLTYYADDYLADDVDELVENVDETIGWENLNHIGEYEEDALHIRNDKLKCDYEILRDLDNYKDVVKN